MQELSSADNLGVLDWVSRVLGVSRGEPARLALLAGLYGILKRQLRTRGM